MYYAKKKNYTRYRSFMIRIKLAKSKRETKGERHTDTQTERYR